MTTDPPSPKKTGRPTIAGEPSTRLTVRLSVRQADALYRRAQQERTTVSALLRRGISSDKH